MLTTITPAIRLFLCQKDETTLLAPWIRHALTIVDKPSDIMIIDDRSIDAQVIQCIKRARKLGIRVRRISTSEKPVFRKKHQLFTKWVQQHNAREPALYIPLDCDEFLAAREIRQEGATNEYATVGLAHLPLNVSLSPDPGAIRQKLHALYREKGNGTWQMERFRNFSHAPALFAVPRPHKWCGDVRKIIVCGGGKATLSKPDSVPNRGYHITSSGPQFGITHNVCLVEFHNLPHEERVAKSAIMRPLVPRRNRDKYKSEALSTRIAYEQEQEQAAHLQPCARCPAFTELVFEPHNKDAP